MKEINILGIDLAKNIFQLCGADKYGNEVLSKKVRRSELLNFLGNLKAELIVMEACGGANYWAKTFIALGFKVKLIAPQFVKPFVKSNKNDYRDAQAIVEAATRPNMRFVPIKQDWQQDIQSIHRVRARLMSHRISVSNEIRGFLLENGIAISLGFKSLRKTLSQISEDKKISISMKALFKRLYEELLYIEEKLQECDKEITEIYKSNEECQRISKIRGIGKITATAIVSTVVNPNDFKNGRQLSAFFGLVPRHVSSGGKTKMLGISKRGDGYLRKLLVQGAKSALRVADKYPEDKISIWALEKQRTRGSNKAAVALANKNIRIVWALMSKKEEYRRAV